MKIKHYRPFFTGLLCLVLALGCALSSVLHGPQPKQVVGLLLLVALGGVNFFFSVSKDSIQEELQGATDERARFIATQSGHKAVQIMNSILFAGSVLAFLAYGLTRQVCWMTVGTTLCAVVVVMFIVFLAANCYYEKKY